jgi:hypothetical protein
MSLAAQNYTGRESFVLSFSRSGMLLPFWKRTLYSKNQAGPQPWNPTLRKEHEGWGARQECPLHTIPQRLKPLE